MKVEKKKLPNGADSLMGVIDIPADTKEVEEQVLQWLVRYTRNSTSNAFQHPIWLKTEITEKPLFLNPELVMLFIRKRLEVISRMLFVLLVLKVKVTLYIRFATHITFQL